MKLEDKAKRLKWRLNYRAWKFKDWKNMIRQTKLVFNLDLFREGEEFERNLIKLTIFILLYNVRKDSTNLYSKVVLHIIRNGYSIFGKIKPKMKNKLV